MAVPVAACGIFVVACGIFSCGRQTLSQGMWDLVAWPGIEPGPPALGVQSYPLDHHANLLKVSTLCSGISFSCSRAQPSVLVLKEKSPSKASRTTILSGKVLISFQSSLLFSSYPFISSIWGFPISPVTTVTWFLIDVLFYTFVCSRSTYRWFSFAVLPDPEIPLLIL